jgi:NADPH-dependent 2,4-dienoyl-CoA reductase/sulfur reductase-like enzyme
MTELLTALNTEHVSLLVIGAGPAGLAAAVYAAVAGVSDILVVDRDKDAGGILNQCIHNGFGLHYFGEELTGPEYAERFTALALEKSIRLELDTMVLSLSPDKKAEVVSPLGGYRLICADAIVLATGCRERTRGAISIPGTRPAGILTAGAAQRYINLEGFMVGRRAIILGSGDIGLIMARRLTLEGAEVVACVELMPYSSGLTRNIVQCLDDYNIPLLLSSTIVEICGKNRVESVIVAEVDDTLQPVPGTETEYEVDTVLLSVGLIPENELAKEAGIEIDRKSRGPVVFENFETSLPGIFACGNTVQVHDLVDFVSEEGKKAGEAAARYLNRDKFAGPSGFSPGLSEPVLELSAGDNISYVVPQRLRLHNIEKNVEVFFRPGMPFPKPASVCVYDGEHCLMRFKRKQMTPGELERIVLPKMLLEKAVSPTLSVRVEAIS